jgi:DNA-binding NtrC family response regulator
MEGGLRVLLVDGQDILVQQGTAVLERLACRVRALSDPLQALSVFHDDPLAFDLVIAEQAMPAMMGIDLARSMLRLRPDLPVLLTTGEGTLDEAVVQEAGVQGVLSKPLQIEAVAEMLQQLLGPDAG